MSKQKIERKKLKGPDAFQTRLLEGAGYLSKNKALLIKLGSGILVVVFATVGIKFALDYKEMQRKSELAEINVEYEKELKDSSEKSDNLQKEIDLLEKNENQSAENKTKIEELKQKLTQIEPNHERSQKRYSDFYNKYSDTPEGWLAALRQVTLLLKNDDYEKSKEILEDVSRRSNDYLVYQIQARMMLVGVLEDSGIYSKH